ncbi:hypothetical protein D3C76_1429650 [compost metagenome]
MADGLEEEQLGSMGPEQFFQYLQVRSVGLTRHTQHIRALQLEFAEQRVVTRVFHQYRIARIDIASDDQVHGMVGPQGRDQLAR